MGARAPTLITGQLAPQRRQLPQLIERSAFVRSRRNGSSTVDQDIAAEPKIVAGAAELVENGPRATDVAFERSRSLLGPGGTYFYKVFGYGMEMSTSALRTFWRLCHPGRWGASMSDITSVRRRLDRGDV